MGKITDMALKSKHDKDKWLSDEAPKGIGQLEARITKAGRVYFYFRYTHKNKQTRFKFGSYTAKDNKGAKGYKGYTLAEARAQVVEYRQLYINGTTDIKGYFNREALLKNAQQEAELAQLEAERLEAESRSTVKELFDKWQRLRLSKYKDGGKEATRISKKDVLPAIGHLPADSIRKGHISAITDAIEERGANRMAKITFSILQRMFTFAMDRDIIEINPTAKLKKSSIGGKDVERDRVLSDEEIKALNAQLKNSGLLPTAQAAIWICLSTCCRIGEISRAEWKYIDIDSRTWIIPEDLSKNDKQISIYLSDFAVRQFKIIQAVTHNTPWVYPNRHKNNHICTKTITKQIGDRQCLAPMSKRTKKSGSLILSGGKWTPHDLRRTGSTIMGSLGIKPVVIDRCQNHIEESKVRKTYQLYTYDPEMKEAWNLLGARLEKLTSGENIAKVIPMKKKEAVRQ
jgi:integrase